MRVGTEAEAVVGRESLGVRGVTCLALLTLWLFAFLPTWRDWLRLCVSDPQYEHGLIVAALGVLVVGRRLLQLSAGALAPSPRGALALALTTLAWTVAWLAGIAALQQLLVVLAGLALVHATLGRAALAATALPFALFLTASEIWEHAAVPLQWLTAAAVGSALPWFGVPVAVEANHVLVPAGEFVIEQGCAGVKYVMIMLAIALLVISAGGFTARTRAVLLGFALVLALIANWVRVGIVIYVGQMTQLRHPWVHDHYTLGWILFGIFLVPFLITARRFGDRDETVKQIAAVASARAAVHAVPLLAIAPLLLAPLAWAIVTIRASGPVGQPHPPVMVGETGPLVLRAFPREAGALPVGLWRYEAGHAPIQVAGTSIRPPLRASGLATLLAAILGPGESVTVRESSGSSPGAGKSVIRFAERLVYRPDLGHRLIRWWFTIGTSTFDRSVQAKVALLARLVLGDDEMTITMVETACEPDCVSAATQLDAFMRRLAHQTRAAP